MEQQHQRLQQQYHLQQQLQQQQLHGYYYQSNYNTTVYQLQQQQQPYLMLPPVQLPHSVGLVQPHRIPVPPWLDPTAAAALATLSQRAQFAGSAMDVPQRLPMYQPVGQPPYGSGGDRVGEPFRGHQGNFGYSHMISSGAGPSFIARAHGQGRCGTIHFPQHGVPSTSSRPRPSVAKDTGSKTEKSVSASALKMQVPNNKNDQVAWCDICKATCTNLTVLEKHKNGKRHKKNMKKIEEMKNAIKSGAELEGQQNETSNPNMEVSHSTQCAQDGEQINKIPGQKHGSKRKKKHKKASETNILIPLICDLCNVKCDRQWIFDDHLSGKKHLANLKRIKGHQVIKGRIGLQALYPPKPNETIFHPQEGKYMPPHVYQEIPVETSSSPPFQEIPTIEGSVALPECGSHNTVTMATESTEKLVTAEPEIKQAAISSMIV